MTGFVSAFERTCRWAPEQGEGLEHLSLRADADGVTATGVVIDLSGSPFTNTLPIRRLAAHTAGHGERFGMVYIPFATLVPEIDEQRYTCVAPFSVYLYQAVDRSFEARLPVDDAGIVTDYPTLFRRRTV